MIMDTEALEDRPVECPPMPALAVGPRGRFGVEQEGIGGVERFGIREVAL